MRIINFLVLLATSLPCQGAVLSPDIVRVIGKLPFAADSEPKVIMDSSPWKISEVAGSVYEQKTTAYVIEGGVIDDVVFFENRRSAREVAHYFSSRWLYLANGIESGYITYRETFETPGSIAHSLSNLPGTLGASERNVVWNVRTMIELRRFASELTAAATNEEAEGVEGEGVEGVKVEGVNALPLR